MSGSEDRSYFVKWHGFSLHLDSSLNRLRQSQDLCDVTLKALGGQLAAHAAILSVSSDLFCNLFMKTEQKPSYHVSSISFPNVPVKHLSCILDFMYEGSTKVLESDLNLFFAIANKLKVKGLTNIADPSYSTNLYGPYPDITISDGTNESITITIAVDEEMDDHQTTEAASDDEAEDEEEEQMDLVDEVDDGYVDNDKENEDDDSSSVDDQELKELSMTQHANGMWQCSECDNLYPLRKSVIIHFRRQHLDQQKLQCLLCHLVLKNKHVFRSHIARKHRIQGIGVVQKFSKKV